MSKQRAQGRNPRRRQQPKARARRGRIGQAGMRRSRGQKLAIAAVAAVVVALVWVFLDWPLAIAMTALLLVALPAVVVLTMGKRY